MKTQINLTKLLAGILVILFLDAVFISQILGQTQGNTQETSYYKLQQVYVPVPVRPDVRYSLDQLKFINVGGVLPTYDGEQFQVNLKGQKMNTVGQARELLSRFLSALESPLKVDKDLRLKMNTATGKADQGYIIEQVQKGETETKQRLSEEFKELSTSSEEMIKELSGDIQKLAEVSVIISGFNQYVEDFPIEGTGISVISRSNSDISSIQGKFYNLVNITNRKPLKASGALSIAIKQIRKENNYDSISGNTTNASMVLLPYGEGFKYAWKIKITGEGPYEVWIDAETGKVLQLFPLFFFADNAKGLVFNPDPSKGTMEMTFEVDPPPGAYIYILKKKDYLTLINASGDGVTGAVSIGAGGSGLANFNVAPINGIIVERTNQANYNGQFQQVNAYAHVFNMMRLYKLLGSQTFDNPVQIRVNNPNPGGLGKNNACAFFSPGDGYVISLGIGSATLSASSLCGDSFNTALDATIIAHELGHHLNWMQFTQGGGQLTGAMDEGLADFWACSDYNTDLMGGWASRNCAATQGGGAPRQADPKDIFPEHFSTGGSTAAHSAGQIICWANWSARSGMNELISYGTLDITLSLMKAMTSAGKGVLNNGSAKSIHNSYQDLLRQLVILNYNSRLVHKILAGYARAGIFLSPKEAVIDINDSYLDRNSATGPIFTVWTGEAYAFSGDQVVTTGAIPCNTRYLIEIANDKDFIVNNQTSGWMSLGPNAVHGTTTWTLSTAQWNAVKSGDNLFYRVKTSDSKGGNERISWYPGEIFMGIGVLVPDGKAAINGTGKKDSACSASAMPVNSAVALIPIVPLSLLIIYRKKRKLPKNFQ